MHNAYIEVRKSVATYYHAAYTATNLRHRLCWDEAGETDSRLTEVEVDSSRIDLFKSCVFSSGLHPSSSPIHSLSLLIETVQSSGKPVNNTWLRQQEAIRARR